jgi:chemotaxis protein methyltransferase CheR
MELNIEDINKFKTELLTFSEYDFSGYSIKSFTRRLEKILNDNNMNVDSLLKKMKKNKSFLEYVIKEITVNTTEPFRTPSIWQNLIPIIKDKFTEKNNINIWHAGCSNGLEVYSMLILLYELQLFDKTQIYGTDLNEDMIEIAKTGKYRIHDFDEYWHNFDEVMSIFPDFKKENYLEINKRRGIVKIAPFLIEKPKFIKHNIIKDGNIFGKNFDLIMCRNVLIYFDHNLQNQIFNFFYNNLSEEGILVIGKHESILSAIQRKFDRIESIYIKKKFPEEWIF